jgi:integrase/recombinase XerC/integrase/recombinase XerD
MYLKRLSNVETESINTLRAYEKDLSQAFSAYKEFNLSDNYRHLLKICFKAQSGWADLKHSSRNRKAASLKGFLKFLFHEGILQSDLSYRIQAPKVPRHIPNFLSVDEVIACLKSFANFEAGEKEQNDRERLLFLILYGAGLRISEAVSLRANQFKVAQRTLRIIGKGGKERLVVLPEPVALYLETLLPKRADGFLFGEHPLSTRVAYNWIRKRGVIAMLNKPLRPHSLRHSYATHLLTSGAQLRVLQELLGHASLQATEKYTHLTMDQLARTMEKHHPLGSK